MFTESVSFKNGIPREKELAKGVSKSPFSDYLEFWINALEFLNMK